MHMCDALVFLGLSLLIMINGDNDDNSGPVFQTNHIRHGSLGQSPSEATFFSATGYKGASVTIPLGGCRNMDSYKFDKRAKSINTSNCLRVYVSPNCRGRILKVTTSLTNLAVPGFNFNGKISSVSDCNTGGYDEVFLFSGKYYAGTNITVPIGFCRNIEYYNDVPLSARFSRKGGCVRLFEHWECTGTMYTITGEGSESISTTLPNPGISSVSDCIVDGTYEATFFDSNDYKGKSYTVPIGTKCNKLSGAMFNLDNRSKSIRTNTCIRVYDVKDCWGKSIQINPPGIEKVEARGMAGIISGFSDCNYWANETSVATLYDKPNLNGESIDVPLGACYYLHNWIGKTASINASSCLRIWQNSHCVWDSKMLEIPAGTTMNLVDLKMNGLVGAVSDCNFRGSDNAILYNKINYEGKSVQVAVGACFNTLHFAHITASIKTSVCVQMFYGPWCTGRSVTLPGGGSPNLYDDGFPNAIRSLKACSEKCETCPKLTTTTTTTTTTPSIEMPTSVLSPTYTTTRWTTIPTEEPTTPTTSTTTQRTTTTTDSPGPDPIPCYNKTDLILILDSSESIGRQNYNTSKYFVEKLTQAFIYGEENHIGFIIYSNDAEFVYPLTIGTDPTLLEKTRGARYIRGQTFTNKALDLAVRDFQNNGRDVLTNIVLLTDGHSVNKTATIRSAKNAIVKGLRVFVVGVVYYVDMDELLSITGGRRDRLFLMESFEDLIDLLKPVSRKVCPTGYGFY